MREVTLPGVCKKRIGYRAVTLLRVCGRFHVISAWGISPKHARHRLGGKVEAAFRDYS